MYHELVIDHFMHPRNVGTIEDADGYAKIESDVCGDMMELYIKVEQGKLADIKFRTFGCAAAIASSSYTSELIKGHSLSEAQALTDDQVAEPLELPDVKTHCSLLAVNALHAAIEDYFARHPEMRPTASAD